MRGSSHMKEGSGTASHKMSDGYHPERKKKKYSVYPTIAPKKGKEKSTDKKDWEKQSERTASKKGEVVYVKRKKRAEKLAAGAWKKGKDRKEAMKTYRNKRKARKEWE